MDVAMKRRLYRLLLSLLAGLVVFLLFALHPRSTFSDLECEWRLLTLDPKRNELWNLTDNITVLTSSESRCAPLQDEFIGCKTILDRMLDSSKNPCSLTESTSVCYGLDQDLDKFLRSKHALNDFWRLFKPSDPADRSRILSTAQVYKALRWKKLQGEGNVLVAIPKSYVTFRNWTVGILRFFFLIKSLVPVRFHVLPHGLMFLDKDRLMYPLEDLWLERADMRDKMLDTTVRWLHSYISRLTTAGLTAEEFKHLFRCGQVPKILVVDFQSDETGQVEALRIYDKIPEQLLQQHNASQSLQLLLHKILIQSVYQLAFGSSAPAQQPEVFSLIDKLEWRPLAVQLNPSFRPDWTEYSAVIPYRTHQLSLIMNGNKKTKEIMFENIKHNKWAVLNLSLGLGQNDFTIQLTNLDPTTGPTIYHFKLHRQTRPENPRPFNPQQDPLRVCQLEQECSWRFKEKMECGLHRYNQHANWSRTLTRWTMLPHCQSGDAEGAWMIPCDDCGLERSCYWSRAIWQPHGCRYASVSGQQLRHCLANRKLIFVGDSTNRGMMESLVERLDGWLTTADRIKWHSFRHRSAGMKTELYFDYYPKFFQKPASQRPTLGETLSTLLRRAAASWNDTILIVGGVDWLTTRHFDVILRVLESKGLSGMRVVIKTSGSGWASRGRNYEDEKSLQEAARRSTALARTARHPPYGFRTVETFNMTVGRHADFLPGRCQCHFHQVRFNPTFYSALFVENKVTPHSISFGIPECGLK